MSLTGVNDAAQAGLCFVDRVAHLAVWIGGTLLLAAAAFIGGDVILRKSIGVSSGGADEYAGYTLAVVTAWAFAFTLLRRGHVRIDVAYNLMPPRVRRVLDLLGLLVLGFFVGRVVWRATLVLRDSISLDARANTPFATPLWIPQVLWVVGWSFFLLTIISLAAAILCAMIARDAASAEQLFGVADAKEEVEAELKAARERLDEAGREERS